jgi:hypothetical protein
MLGITIWFFLSARRTAWPSYTLARLWLAFRGWLPWRLESFLDDAHQRGVLRQAGAVYQFRHIELQHRLATRPAAVRQPCQARTLTKAATPERNEPLDYGPDPETLRPAVHKHFPPSKLSG